jgi:hypothetical protein
MDEPFPPPGFKPHMPSKMCVFNMAYGVWCVSINLVMYLMLWAGIMTVVGHITSYDPQYNQSNSFSTEYTFNYMFELENKTYIGKDHLTFGNDSLLQEIVSTGQIRVYYAHYHPISNGLSLRFANVSMYLNIALICGMSMIWFGINLRHWRQNRHYYRV